MNISTFAGNTQTYYEILDLQRSATHEQIVRNFKSMATRYHPLKNPTDMTTNTFRFRQICEAFDILSNRK